MDALIIPLTKCFECDNDMDDMHHVVPKSKGGTKVIPLCSKCHGLVHDANFLKYRVLQKEGIAKAKKEGKYKGRIHGSETIEQFLNKSINKKAVKLMNEGYSHKEISYLVKIHINTLTKIKKILNNKAEDSSL